MAALSQAVIDNAANAALAYHFDRGKIHYQHIQAKPLLAGLQAKQKEFPGGNAELTCSVAWETQSKMSGFEGDDTLVFGNPTPIKKARYPWKQLHIGLQVTTEELLLDGIGVVDTTTFEKTRALSGRAQQALANILEAKLTDLSEGYAADMNTMLWKDGTQSAKEVPGLAHLIADNPAVGTVGGINRAQVPFWRNQAMTIASGNPLSRTAIIRPLQAKVRQLRRYGNPQYLILCGSVFMDLIEDEYYAKGNFTQTGFAKGQDIGMGVLSINGLGTLQYDPTLDTLGREDYAYFIDTRAIQLRPIEGEDQKIHNPARPHDKMVMYRSFTWAGGLTMTQSNTSMVVQVAAVAGGGS